jgi:hypothetical protein
MVEGEGVNIACPVDDMKKMEVFTLLRTEGWSEEERTRVQDVQGSGYEVMGGARLQRLRRRQQVTCMGVKWNGYGSEQVASQLETQDGSWHALMIQGKQRSRKQTGITSEHGHSLHRVRCKLYLLSGDVCMVDCHDCHETTTKEKYAERRPSRAGRYQKQRRH